MALDLAQVMAVVQSNYAKDPSFLVSSSNFSSTPAFPIARSKSDFDKRGDSRHGHGGGGGGNEAELFAAAAAAASDASCSRRLVCMPFGNDDSSGFMHLEDGRRAAAAHLHMEQSRGGGGLVYPSSIGLGTIRNDRSTSNSSVTESCLTMDLLPSCSHSKDDKRKGGWPKGKKRKDGILDSKAPKAPTTGYVLFLTERRRFYKDNHPEVSFAEVTKVLGHEWTRLPRNEKQKYLDEAEEDKKRYRRELNVYRQSESYRMKRSNGDGGHRSNDGNSIDFDDDVSDDLYCDVCDQFFSSLHNKKEHLYGRQHLQSITESTRSTSHCRRQSTDDEINDDPYDNHYRSDLVSNIPQAIQDFMEMTAGRELEVKELRQHLTSGKTRNSLLLGEISKLQALERRLRCGIDDLQTQELRLKEQLGNLRMVPSLFGVINFQHQV